MKKKIVHQDDLIIVACGAVGYGGGLALADEMGYDMAMQYVICTVTGLLITFVVEKLKTIFGNKKGNVYGVVFTLLCAAVMEAIGIFYFGKTLMEVIIQEVGLETTLYGLVPAIAIYLFSAISYRIKRARLIKKFGDGSLGYTVDEKGEQLIKKHEGINQQLDEKALKGAVYVKTKHGIYVGKANKKQLTFLGIPYAKSPVGELRFKAPAPLDESEDIFEAKYFGASALQADSQSNVLMNHRQDEDCLYLNIWTTKSEEKNRPVLVYVPGGDIDYNGGAMPLNNGENFAKANPDIIFVNFNYRLGATSLLDFSDVPGGEEYKDSVQLPILDMLQAFRWLKENISAFGGNPDNITVATDNSGSTFIATLTASEKARGLYQRVFLIGCNLDFCSPDTAKGKELANKLLEETHSSTMADIMKLEQSTLKTFIHKHVYDFKTLWLDGELLPSDIYEAYKNGKTGDVEFVFSVPANAMSLWFMLYGEEEYKKLIKGSYDKFLCEIDKERSEKIEALRKVFISKGKTEVEAMEQVLNFAFYTECSIILADLLIKAGKKVRFCYWNVDSPVKKFGPNMISQVCAMLGNDAVAENYGYLYDKNLSDVVMRLLSNYVRNGNPDIKNDEIKGMKGVNWRLYTEEDRDVLNITDNDVKSESHLLRSVFE